MAKIVYNTCFGGFGLSDEAIALLLQKKGAFREHSLARDDKDLVEVVETLGSKKASGHFADLAIAEVPAGTHWHIHEYDGNETVMTPESYTWNIAKD